MLSWIIQVLKPLAARRYQFHATLIQRERDLKLIFRIVKKEIVVNPNFRKAAGIPFGSTHKLSYLRMHKQERHGLKNKSKNKPNY